MDRQKQFEENALNGFQRDIQPNRISGILLHFEGTNDTATPGDLDDLGTVVIKRKGTTLVNRPVGVFGDMNDIRGGSNIFSSTGSGAFEATVFIPFFALGLEQAYRITGASELNFEWQPANGISTTFSAMTISGYSQIAFREERYLYYILGEDQTPAGAVTARPYQLNKDNVTEIYLRDSASILTSAALRQDGRQKFSDQPKAVLEAGTLLDNFLEVNNFDMIQLQTYTIGEPLSVYNTDSVLELTTSAGGDTIEITICNIQPRSGFPGLRGRGNGN